MHIGNLPYKATQLHWIEYKQRIEGSSPAARFVHVTDMAINQKMTGISWHGRLGHKADRYHLEVYADIVASMGKTVFCQECIKTALDNCRQLRY